MDRQFINEKLKKDLSTSQIRDLLGGGQNNSRVTRMNSSMAIRDDAES